MPTRKATDACDHEHEDDLVALDEENRRIYLIGAITDNRASNFLMALQSLDSKEGPITVILNSPGGSTYAGYTIYDAITLAQNPVIVQGIGKVFSMAVLILQAGDLRVLTPQAELMVHDVYASIQNDEMEIKDAGKLANDLVENNRRYQRLVAKRCKMSPAKLAKLCAKETYLRAEEAVELGFADQILRPKKRVVKR